MYGNQKFGLFHASDGSQNPQTIDNKIPVGTVMNPMPRISQTGSLDLLGDAQNVIPPNVFPSPDLRPDVPIDPPMGDSIDEEIDGANEVPESEPVQTDEETTADNQIEQTDSEPEAEPEPEAKTQISGGTVEFALPEWFKDSFTKGAKVVGVGILGYVAFVVADRLGVADKISDALKSDRKSEPQKSSVTSE